MDKNKNHKTSLRTPLAIFAMLFDRLAEEETNEVYRAQRRREAEKIRELARAEPAPTLPSNKEPVNKKNLTPTPSVPEKISTVKRIIKLLVKVRDISLMVTIIALLLLISVGFFKGLELFVEYVMSSKYFWIAYAFFTIVGLIWGLKETKS